MTLRRSNFPFRFAKTSGSADSNILAHTLDISLKSSLDIDIDTQVR